MCDSVGTTQAEAVGRTFLCIARSSADRLDKVTRHVQGYKLCRLRRILYYTMLRLLSIPFCLVQGAPTTTPQTYPCIPTDLRRASLIISLSVLYRRHVVRQLAHRKNLLAAKL